MPRSEFLVHALVNSRQNNWDNVLYGADIIYILKLHSVQKNIAQFVAQKQYKSNSMEGAVRVEAKVPMQFFYNKCITKCLTLKTKVKVTEYNIHHDAIQCRIWTSAKVIWRIFAIAHIIFEILMFQICEIYTMDILQTLGGTLLHKP